MVNMIFPQYSRLRSDGKHPIRIPHTLAASSNRIVPRDCWLYLVLGINSCILVKICDGHYSLEFGLGSNCPMIEQTSNYPTLLWAE